VYGFVKKIIQIFVPEAASTQVWFYVDMFLPFLLPTIPINRRSQAALKMHLNQRRPFLFNPHGRLNDHVDTMVNDLVDQYNGTIDLTMSLAKGRKLDAVFVNESSSSSSSSAGDDSFNTTVHNSTLVKHLIKRAIEQYFDDLDNHLSASLGGNNTTGFENSTMGSDMDDKLGFDFSKFFQSPDFNIAGSGKSEHEDAYELGDSDNSTADSRCKLEYKLIFGRSA
jgi:hypothetical protein